MVANLNHLSLVKNYDLVGILYGTQAMSNNHNRLALIELIQVFHDITLIVGIKRVGCLVQEDIVWVLINSPCYQDALLLSLAQLSGFYHVKVEYVDTGAQHIRLFFNWNKTKTLEQNLEILNAFDRIQIEYIDGTLMVK